MQVSSMRCASSSTASSGSSSDRRCAGRSRVVQGDAGTEAAMDVTPVVEALVEGRCRFVVVGSAARRLLGEQVTPNDLDIVVAAAPGDRERLVDVLAALGAMVRHRRGWRPIELAGPLPWRWGWRARVAGGEIDVIVAFVDGSTFDEHEAEARTVVLGGGSSVRCRPTSWVDDARSAVVAS